MIDSDTEIYCYEQTTFRSHISSSAMKLLIILTFCLGFVVCRDTLMINLPSETGPSPMPAIYQSIPAVPEEFLPEEEPPYKKVGNTELLDH